MVIVFKTFFERSFIILNTKDKLRIFELFSFVKTKTYESIKSVCNV